MGCDLHASMEVLFDGKWFCIGALDSDRNYSLFGKLSGVRGEDDEPFFEVGGELPDDVTDEVRADYGEWGDDAHSLTIVDYRGLEEFCKHFRKPTKRWSSISRADRGLWRGGKKEFDLFFAASYVNDWLSIARKFIEIGAEDVRIVIWYDN